MWGVFELIGAFILGASSFDAAEGAQPREHREHVGQWQVSAFTAGTCSVTREFRDGTMFLVSSTREGRADLAVLNRAWPVRTADPTA
ncbi:MAG TPA: hypothetical protein VF548_11565 [Allosphingosinicella sp.]